MLEQKRISGFFSLRRFEKGVWTVIIIRFLNMFAYAVFGPYLMLYLSQDLGLTTTLAGLIIALSTVTGSFTQILGGFFTDRFGRRRTLVLFFSIGLLFNIFITIMIAVAAPAWLFITVYIVSGVIWGMTQPAVMAVLTDLTPNEDLTEAYGVAQLIANIGWIIGPIAGGVMFSRFPFTYLYGTTIIVGVVSLMVTIFFLKDSFTGNQESSSLRGMFPYKQDRALITYVILSMMVFVVYVQITGAYSVFTVAQLGFTTTQYGLLLMINGILAVVFQYPVTRWVTTRLGDKNALVLGSVIFGLAYLSLAWVRSFGWSVGAIVAFTAAELLFVPSMTSTVGRLAGPEQRGRYMGLLGTGTGLGIAIAPLLGGAMFDVSRGAPLLMWGPIAAITFVAALGYLRWFYAYNKRMQ